jgi:hypothetical protein
VEQQLVQWMQRLDIIPAAAERPGVCSGGSCGGWAAEPFSSLVVELSGGVLLAEVVAAMYACARLPLPAGLLQAAARAADRAWVMQQVMQALRGLPRFDCRALLPQHEAALWAGERVAVTMLLQAMQRWHAARHAGA